MKKFLPDLIAILAFIILSFAYFFPADIEGRILFQPIRCLRVTTRQRP